MSELSVGDVLLDIVETTELGNVELVVLMLAGLLIGTTEFDVALLRLAFGAIIKLVIPPASENRNKGLNYFRNGEYGAQSAVCD